MKYPVLLPNIFDHPFTYLSNIKLKPGDYVKVPFGKKNIIGVIWDIFEEKNKKEFKLKSITEKIEIEPLSKNTINFLKWFSNYNIVPLGMCLKLHLINDENLKIKNDKDLLKYDVSNEKKFINFLKNKITLIKNYQNMITALGFIYFKEKQVQVKQ